MEIGFGFLDQAVQGLLKGCRDMLGALAQRVKHAHQDLSGASTRLGLGTETDVAGDDQGTGQRQLFFLGSAEPNSTLL